MVPCDFVLCLDLRKINRDTLDKRIRNQKGTERRSDEPSFTGLKEMVINVKICAWVQDPDYKGIQTGMS